MDTFINLLVLGVILIALFYAICFIIKLWTGCTTEEAANKIRNFFNGNIQYHLYDDPGFINDIWENVKRIIGDKSFEYHKRLSGTQLSFPLLTHGLRGGLSYVAVSVYYADQNEKQALESVIVNVVKRYLKRYGYSPVVSTKWDTRYDFNMPMLIITYSRNEKERQALAKLIQETQQSIVAQYSPVTDDEEDEDLFE